MKRKKKGIPSIDGYCTFMVNRDPNKIIKWDIEDKTMRDRFGVLLENTGNLLNKASRIVDTIGDDNTEVILADERIKDLGNRINRQFDQCFGDGTAAMLFDGVNPIGVSRKSKKCLVLDAIEQIVPGIEETMLCGRKIRG